MFAALRGGMSQAGVTVTDDRALTLMPVWRCQHMIADIVSGLPVQQFRRRSGRTDEIDRSTIVSAPSDLVSAQEWRYALLLDALRWGNALAVTTRLDSFGFPLKAETVSWADVVVRQPDGALSPPTYQVHRREVDSGRVHHLRAYGPVAGSVLGMSPIAYARETIGLGLAVRQFGAEWYASGGHPTTVLTTTQQIEAKQALEAKERFRQATRGDHIAVMGNGWELKSVQVAPDDALFLAASNATAIDICGFYGIPPELLGYTPSNTGSLTYSNREQRAIDVLVFTLQWWVGRIERLISALLPAGQFVRVNLDGFLRSDAAVRWQVHKTAVELGVRSRNEVRELEDESPLPEGGDEFTWPPGGA
jgi:HK97 family phage portal protein